MTSLQNSAVSVVLSGTVYLVSPVWRERALPCSNDASGFNLTQSVSKVILQQPIPTRIRQRILYIRNSKG